MRPRRARSIAPLYGGAALCGLFTPANFSKMNNAKKIFKIQSKITDLRLKLQKLKQDKSKHAAEISRIESEILRLSNHSG